MNNNVEKILTEETGMPVKCTVLMDGLMHESDDFVCVMAKENGDASIFYNTDALTLGMAMKMVAKSFVEAMHQLSEEERESVQEVLNDAAVYDKPQEVTN